MTDTVKDRAAVISELWRTHLGPGADLNADLVAAGGDSLIAIRLLRDMEQRFDMEINLGDLAGGISIERLVNLVDQWQRTAEAAQDRWLTL